jgi:general secretion pathway protein G
VKIKTRLERRPVRGGFTLLEVLLVLAILVVLAAMVVPNLLGRQREALVRASRTNIAGLENAVKLYAQNHDGEYPRGTEDDVFPLLMSGTDHRGRPQDPYLDALPLDGWKNPLRYEYPPSSNRPTIGNKPAIWSVGPDGQDGTEDDVTNWNDGY